VEGWRLMMEEKEMLIEMMLVIMEEKVVEKRSVGEEHE